MGLTHTLFTFALVLLTLTAPCQPRKYSFERMDISQGLSHSQVNCFLKDNKGFIWIGTLSGLNRFDGYNFKVFKHNSRDSTSLSDNYITSIFKIPGNKLWIGTRNGANIYNPATESFDREYEQYLHQLSLPYGEVSDIIKGRRGYYWFVHTKGLYRYDPAGDTALQIAHRNGDDSTPDSDSISAFGQDVHGDFWIIQHNGLIEKLDGNSLKVTYRNDALLKEGHGESHIFNLWIDRQGCLWIYLKEEARGVYCFDPTSLSFLHFSKGDNKYPLNNNIITGITQDSKGIIWIGTDHGGVNLIDKKDFSVSYLLYNPADEKSLSRNSLFSIYNDQNGITWVGTYKKGFCYYNENLSRFPLYRHEPADPNSLNYEDVNRFVEDAKGNLWIGTNGGGLIYFNRKQQTFTQYVHHPGKANSLCNDVVVSLFLDHENKLWIGTYYGGLDCYDGKTFTHYRYNSNIPGSLSNDKVWDIFEDSRNNLWVGTLGSGLDRLDRNHHTFIHYKLSNLPSNSFGYIASITEDHSGNLWIGTAGGVAVMNIATGRIIHYNHEKNNPNSLSNDNVNSIFEDSRGWMWIATREGLSRLDPHTGQFRIFTKSDGLPDNTILTILEDDRHELWLGTPHGLSNLQIGKTDSGTYAYRFRNYDELDGLQGRSFNNNAAYKTSSGELIFGGPNGFNLFDPEKIKINEHVPPVVLTDLMIFNKKVNVGEEIKKHLILEQALPETRSLTLRHNENDFSIEFAALSFSRSEKNKYAYKLEGFNDEWIQADGRQRKATYTNLDPGKYIFHVIASNNDGIWNKKGAILHITILPPFWKTVWAYLLYFLLIVTALWLARKILLERARMRFRLEQQKQEALRIQELDKMKTRFFTNVSHEFRTPLTLIITPLDKLIRENGPSDLKQQLQMIQRNARRLLNLVNQLLDFRKMEVQEIGLNPSEGDIIKFIKEISYSFSDLSDKKNIQFSFYSNISSLDTLFDADKLEKILFNLLSNAFKFTHENGSVSVEVTLNNPDTDIEKRHLLIRVTDTGIGIPPEEQDKIFDRYFQHNLPGSVVNQGSGIGLAITKEFVRLHGGHVTVVSEPGKSTCFTVYLPVPEISKAGSFLSINEEIRSPEETTKTETGEWSVQKIKSDKRPLLLLIEDNEDFRFYLKDNLKQYYHIAEASDGRDGWRKALSLHPDLIVSDIMMPELNGNDLCRKIKNDARTTQIPVILLTARSAEEQQLEGLETGADDYIAKPFNFEILLSKIKNLIIQRELAKKTYQKKVDFQPSEVDVPSQDQVFIKEAMEIVEKHLSESGFSVEQLSKALFISRVGLYKKLLSLTGKTPIEFIRSIRLKRAAQLMEKSNMTVSQIAYEVGFNNPKNFSKYFKAEYQVLPSVYIQQKKNEELS